MRKIESLEYHILFLVTVLVISTCLSFQIFLSNSSSSSLKMIIISFSSTRAVCVSRTTSPSSRRVAPSIPRNKIYRIEMTTHFTQQVTFALLLKFFCGLFKLYPTYMHNARLVLTMNVNRRICGELNRDLAI